MYTKQPTPPIVMTIAGSDSGAGAGIQADLKTFAAHNVYGTSVLTAVTAQNTTGVIDVQELSVTMVAHQIQAVMEDMPVQAIKTGMLSSSDIITQVVSSLNQYGVQQLVVDPVMVAKGGAKLIQDEAIQTLKEKLLPHALVLTPNIPEAEVLTGLSIATLADARHAAKILISMGPKTVVIKGGHRKGEPIDIFYDGTSYHEFTSDRITTTSDHGTGCTFSAAITANLAKNLSVKDAVEQAKIYVSASLRSAYPVGKGHGPLNHFGHLHPPR
jgi:hydroxymethylpyrimidine/phosphomethylpyrimidine kinase